MNYLQGKNKERKRDHENNIKYNATAVYSQGNKGPANMPVAQDYYGCASLLGHNDYKVDEGYLFKISIAFHSPSSASPARPSLLKPRADPRATSSYPSTRRHVPSITP